MTKDRDTPRPPSASRSDDPMEKMIRDALVEGGICFDDKDATGLDFYLPVQNVFIETKQFHSARIGEQMSRAGNVIAVQGAEACKWLAALIRNSSHTGTFDPRTHYACRKPHWLFDWIVFGIVAAFLLATAISLRALLD